MRVCSETICRIGPGWKTSWQSAHSESIGSDYCERCWGLVTVADNARAGDDDFLKIGLRGLVLRKRLRRKKTNRERQS